MDFILLLSPHKNKIKWSDISFDSTTVQKNTGNFRGISLWKLTPPLVTNLASTSIVSICLWRYPYPTCDGRVNTTIYEVPSRKQLRKTDNKLNDLYLVVDCSSLKITRQQRMLRIFLFQILQIIKNVLKSSKMVLQPFAIPLT